MKLTEPRDKEQEFLRLIEEGIKELKEKPPAHYKVVVADYKKKKEDELTIRDGYAHMMPRNLWGYYLPGQRLAIINPRLYGNERCETAHHETRHHNRPWETEEEVRTGVRYEYSRSQN